MSQAASAPSPVTGRGRRTLTARAITPITPLSPTASMSRLSGSVHKAAVSARIGRICTCRPPRSPMASRADTPSTPVAAPPTRLPPRRRSTARGRGVRSVGGVQAVASGTEDGLRRRVPHGSPSAVAPSERTSSVTSPSLRSLTATRRVTRTVLTALSPRCGVVTGAHTR